MGSVTAEASAGMDIPADESDYIGHDNVPRPGDVETSGDSACVFPLVGMADGGQSRPNPSHPMLVSSAPASQRTLPFASCFGR
jgi:hypothetical protein